jgi:membrane protein involved in colicin uptake
LDEVDTPPVTMYRAKVEKTEAKPADGEVAGQKTLTVDDFEKAASGAVAAPAETAEKTDAVKPLTKSAVRAANEKAEAEKAAARAANERAAAERVAEQKAAADRVAEAKIAEADRLAARPSGQRLPMGGYAAGGGTDGTLYGAKRSVVIVRPPVKTTAAAPV